MIEITGVNILKSKLGHGLKINDIEVGVATITSIEDEERLLTSDTFVKGFGIVPKSTEDPSSGISVEFKDDLKDAKNYVLVTVDDSDNVSIIHSPAELCDIFEIEDKDDIDKFNNYLPYLAGERQLTMFTNESILYNGEPVMFFVNNIDLEIMYALSDGDNDKAEEIAKSIYMNSQYRSEYDTDNFIKLFLIAIVDACQNRYNIVNKDAVLKDVADMLSGITYWKDGQLGKSTVADIDDYIATIKTMIKVG